MAVFRTAPKCPKCGKEYSGVYRNNDGSFIGDDFVKWDIEGHVCEKESTPVTGTAEEITMCVMGCRHFTGGEIKHDKNCPHYPDSLSLKLDVMESYVERLTKALGWARTGYVNLVDLGILDFKYCEDANRMIDRIDNVLNSIKK